MRFMLMTRADKGSEAGEFPSPEVMEEMGKMMEELTSTGVLLSGEGLLPSSQGSRLKISNGKVTVTDGPFPDTIANFAIVNVASKEEAIELATRWGKLFGELECEIRPIMDGPEMPE